MPRHSRLLRPACPVAESIPCRFRLHGYCCHAAFEEHCPIPTLVAAFLSSIHGIREANEAATGVGRQGGGIGAQETAGEGQESADEGRHGVRSTEY